MNENDGGDREVREYVLNRMAADMPPEFTRDVMNDVQRTRQRGRGFAWPIFTGLATVAAAIAVVIIGLGFLNQADGIGSQPSASPSGSVSPAPTHSATPEPSVSEEASPSAAAEPTIGEGQFGPIHSMAPDDAFADAQTCEVTEAIVNAEPTDLTWEISFPEGWYTNEESTQLRSSCTLFASEPFAASDDQAIPESVAIVADVSPGGDYDAGSAAVSMEHTVDGVAAVRYEIQPEGFVTEPTVLWIIAIAGNLPAEGNDRPYLALFTASSDPAELAANADILDRMVATLNVGE
jgi:hypothetical protein